MTEERNVTYEQGHEVTCEVELSLRELNFLIEAMHILASDGYGSIAEEHARDYLLGKLIEHYRQLSDVKREEPKE